MTARAQRQRERAHLTIVDGLFPARTLRRARVLPLTPLTMAHLPTHRSENTATPEARHDESCIPHAQPGSVEHPGCGESGLAVRRIRNLRPDPDRGTGFAGTAGSLAPSTNSGLRGHHHRDQPAWMGHRRHDRRRPGGLSGSPADDDDRGARVFVDDGTERLLLQLAFICDPALPGWGGGAGSGNLVRTQWRTMD